MSNVLELIGFALFVAGIYLLTGLGWALLATAIVCVLVGWAMGAAEAPEPQSQERKRVREPREPTTNRMIDERQTVDFDVLS